MYPFLPALSYFFCNSNNGFSVIDIISSKDNVKISITTFDILVVDRFIFSLVFTATSRLYNQYSFKLPWTVCRMMRMLCYIRPLPCQWMTLLLALLCKMQICRRQLQMIKTWLWVCAFVCLSVLVLYTCGYMVYGICISNPSIPANYKQSSYPKQHEHWTDTHHNTNTLTRRYRSFQKMDTTCKELAKNVLIYINSVLLNQR